MRTADVPGLDGVIYEGTWVVTLATKLLEYGAYRHGMTKRAAQDSCTARWTSHSHPPPPQSSHPISESAHLGSISTETQPWACKKPPSPILPEPISAIFHANNPEANASRTQPRHLLRPRRRGGRVGGRLRLCAALLPQGHAAVRRPLRPTLQPPAPHSHLGCTDACCGELSLLTDDAPRTRIWRSSLIMAFICCYLMWAVTYLAQLNPLEMPKRSTLRA